MALKSFRDVSVEEFKEAFVRAHKEHLTFRVLARTMGWKASVISKHFERMCAKEPAFISHKLPANHKEARIKWPKQKASTAINVPTEADAADLLSRISAL